MHSLIFENTFYLFKKCVLAFVCKEICSHIVQLPSAVVEIETIKIRKRFVLLPHHIEKRSKWKKNRYS